MITTSSKKVEFHDTKYNEGSEYLQPYKTKLVELLLADCTRGRVLDIGCGSGLISAELKRAGCDPVGIDISLPAMRKYLAAGCPGLICNLEAALPFKDSAFDLVWVSEVIEYIVEDSALIGEICRVLRPKGKLYISTPNSAFIGYRLLSMLGKAPTETQDPYHIRFYSYDYLERKLSEGGFAVVESMGQNIYVYLPSAAVHAVDELPPGVSNIVWALLSRVGLRPVPGMIRGNKVMGYWFGKKFRRLLSSCIMMVGVKKSHDRPGGI